MNTRNLLINFLAWYQRCTQEEESNNDQLMNEVTVDSYLSEISKYKSEPDTVAISETERGCLKCGLIIKEPTSTVVSEAEIEDDIKEIAHFYDGWEALQKVVQKLKDNADDELGERSMNEPGAWEGGFADNH